MLWAVFVASLLGSVHCAAMCGPLAAAAEAGRGRARSRLAYHGGRLAVYLALGALAGAAGGLLDRFGLRLGWSASAARVAGVLLIAFGLVTLLRSLGLRLGRRDPLATFTAGLYRRLRQVPPAARGVTLGAASALLPCGWLYAFVAAAGGTGSPVQGALAMAVFWTGTVPAVATAGLLLQRVTGSLRRRLPAVTAIALIAIGLLAALGRAPGHHATMTAALPPVAHDAAPR
jgi:uncharacterized protein